MWLSLHQGIYDLVKTMPIVADFRSLSNPEEINYLREREAKRPEDHLDGLYELPEIMSFEKPAKLALPSSPPDPHSFSPSTLGAAAPPRIRTRSKDFYNTGSQVLTNAQVQKSGLVGSPSSRDSPSGAYRPLGAAFKKPGTKLASEHHGGKAGRLLQQRCKCGGQMQYDAREEPFCTACGQGFKDAPRPQSPHKRMRGFKKFRMYAKSI
jgi:hypothetical protein